MTLKERQIKPRNVQFQLKQVISGDGVKHVWMKKKFLALKVFHSIICELLFFFYIHHFSTLSSFTSCWQWCLYGKGGRTEVNTGNLWLPPPAHLHCNLHTQIHCWPRQFPYHLKFTRWWSPLLPLLRGIQDSPGCRFEEFQGKNWARFWQLGQRWRWQAHLMANSATPMSALWLVERRGEAAPWLVDSGSQHRGFVLLASAQPDIDYGPGRGGVVFKLCQKFKGCSFLIFTSQKVEDGKIPTENMESEATFSLLW